MSSSITDHWKKFARIMPNVDCANWFILNNFINFVFRYKLANQLRIGFESYHFHKTFCIRNLLLINSKINILSIRAHFINQPTSNFLLPFLFTRTTTKVKLYIIEKFVALLTESCNKTHIMDSNIIRLRNGRQRVLFGE